MPRCLLVLFALAALAFAETGPSLVLRPGDGASLRTEIQGYLDDRADTVLVTIDGAWRSEKIRLGTTARWLEVDGAGLPNRLADVSYAAGFDVGSWESWDLKAVVGFGSASNRPFADSRGWYGLATLAAVKEIDRSRRWAVLLSYDGNRGFLPHVPLPGLQYQRFVHPGLRFVVGFPYNSVFFKPNEKWELEAAGIPPFGLSARAAYLPAPGWKIFIRYGASRVRAHVDGTASRFSLRYEQQLVEAGVAWEPRDDWKVTLAGGYGFEREFEFESESGRDFGRVGLSDAPYVRLELAFTF